jgi:hypothetical protein
MKKKNQQKKKTTKDPFYIEISRKLKEQKKRSIRFSKMINTSLKVLQNQTHNDSNQQENGSKQIKLKKKNKMTSRNRSACANKDVTVNSLIKTFQSKCQSSFESLSDKESIIYEFLTKLVECEWEDVIELVDKYRFQISKISKSLISRSQFLKIIKNKVKVTINKQSLR